jgi:hypothetical protein
MSISGQCGILALEHPGEDRVRDTVARPRPPGNR